MLGYMTWTEFKKQRKPTTGTARVRWEHSTDYGYSLKYVNDVPIRFYRHGEREYDENGRRVGVLSKRHISHR